MDPITQQTALATAGAAGAGEGLYVDEVFSTYVYDGTGTTNTITNGIDLAGEGGMVWCKGRDGNIYGRVHDTERGLNASGYANIIRFDSTGAEITSFTNGIDSFNSDGFTIQGSNNTINSTTYDYASWTFRKAPGFFDVVTYTGNGTAGRTVAHNLGSQPGTILVKKTNNTGNWSVYHRSLGATKYVLLNLSNAEGTSNSQWNDTEPTSTEFTVGSSSLVNANGSSYVAYLFAHDDQSFGTNGDESIIKCGSYTGTGTAGNFVDLGFEPQFLIVKKSNGTGNWFVCDSIRGMADMSNGNVFLRVNTSDAEVTTTSFVTQATGFRIDSTGNESNNSGGEFVYIAIRRSHKPPSAGTEVFSADDQSSGSGAGGVSFSAPSFPIDLMIAKRASSNADWAWMDRLRGYNKNLKPHSSNAESAENYLAGFDQNSGYTVGSNGGVLNETDSVTWCFKRAAGVFDMVTYVGTGSARTISHNLGAVPKMMIVKKRDSGESWSVYTEAYGNNKTLWLNDNSGGVTSTQRWNSTTPTDSVFSVGTDTGTNGSGGEYVAYLFGDVSGISKVGSYTGTGGNINVDCGFTAGARFVLIKRYGGSGEWHLWDSTRGIVAGNDPYLELNAIAPEKTTFDYLDPLNSGFTVTSTANNDLNENGGTYVFLAIA